MSEELTPPPYSSRELTLRAISLTFQRARAVQRELSGSPAWMLPEPPNDPDADSSRPDADIDDSPPRPDGNGGQPGPPDMSLDESEEPDLPNPLVTDSNFRHYLDQATAHQGRIGGGPLGLGRMASLASNQALFNAAIVHALHQLDHRTRLQQRTITRLEAELAAAHRALSGLESHDLRDS